MIIVMLQRRLYLLLCNCYNVASLLQRCRRLCCGHFGWLSLRQCTQLGGGPLTAHHHRAVRPHRHIVQQLHEAEQAGADKQSGRTAH